MPGIETESEKLAGKLISAIQKVWGKQAGEPEAEESERIMDLAHQLMQAREPGKMRELLAGKSVPQFIGEIWLQKHPGLKPIVKELSNEIEKAILTLKEK